MLAVGQLGFFEIKFLTVGALQNYASSCHIL